MSKVKTAGSSKRTQAATASSAAKTAPALTGKVTKSTSKSASAVKAPAKDASKAVASAEKANTPVSYPVPPWAFKGEGCPACLKNGTPGYAADGSFCRICVSWAEKNGIYPEHFFLGRNEEGELVWALREDYMAEDAYQTLYAEGKVLLEGEVEHVCDSADVISFLSGGEEAAEEQEEDSSEEAAEEEQEEQEEPAEEEQEEQEEEQEEPAEEEQEEPAAKKTSRRIATSSKASNKPAAAASASASPAKSAGRPPKSFKLIRGHVAKFPNTKAGTGRHVVHGDDLLAQGKAHVVSESGVDSFYELEHFPALDALRRWTEETLAPQLEADADIVVFSPDYATGSAEQVLFTSLRPFAETVIC